MGQDRQEQMIALLRTQGGRVTTARRAVIGALVGARGHVTAEDLADRVQAAHPDVHLSTVYRTLDALEHMGIVDHTHLGHGRAVYHLADDPHQHLVCEVCGKVVEVPDATFAELAGQLEAGYGFAIRPSHFAVLGRCAACARGGGAAGQP
ncbi:MAG: Fur family transcriptional regulator [Acidimicrobiales bacterium]